MTLQLIFTRKKFSLTRTLIIGLDGATFKLLKPWMEEGNLPNLASIARNGVTGKLRSVIPPLSPSAWPAFFTGKEAGKTGIFAFGNASKSHRGMESDSLINFSDVNALSLWRILSDQGCKVGVVNIPVTWPPEPVNGFLITAFFTPPDAKEFTYPSSLKAELDDYQIDIELEKYGGHMPESGVDRQELLREQYRITQNRFRNIVNLIKKYEPDFFCVNFKGLDVVQHFFWHDKAVILNYLQLLDGYIGELRVLMSPCVTFVMSDHGFHARGDIYFHVNSWLEREGYLIRSSQLRGRASASLYTFGVRLVEQFGWIRELIPEKMKRWAVTEQIHDQIDWTATKAHATRWGLYVNEETVGAEEKEALRDELIQRLEGVVDPGTGQKVFQKLWRKEELHAGDYLCHLPDVIFLQSVKYKVNPTLRELIFARRVDSPAQTGSHGADPDGILIVAGARIEKQKEIVGARIVDLAPTVLHIMGVPVADDMDGRVLTELFDPNAELAKRKIAYQSYSLEKKEEIEWSESDEEAVRGRLKGLGYID